LKDIRIHVEMKIQRNFKFQTLKIGKAFEERQIILEILYNKLLKNFLINNSTSKLKLYLVHNAFSQSCGNVFFVSCWIANLN